MLYQKPVLEILKSEVEDVICASIGGDHDGGSPGEGRSDASGSWAPPTN